MCSEYDSNLSWIVCWPMSEFRRTFCYGIIRTSVYFFTPIHSPPNTRVTVTSLSQPSLTRLKLQHGASVMSRLVPSGPNRRKNKRLRRLASLSLLYLINTMRHEAATLHRKLRGGRTIWRLHCLKGHLSASTQWMWNNWISVFCGRGFDLYIK